MYTYIPKQSLSNPYIVTYVNVSSIDHLPLDKQLLCSSLGKTTSPASRLSLADNSSDALYFSSLPPPVPIEHVVMPNRLKFWK